MQNLNFEIDAVCGNLTVWKKCNSTKNAKYHIILLYLKKPNEAHMMHEVLKENEW